MSADDREPEGITIHKLTLGGIGAVLGLLASGVATYTVLQNDIASLKRGEVYQERTNERLSEELKLARIEQRETMQQFNEKLDRVIEHWARRKH